MLSKIDLDSLQKALTAMGSPWEAGITSVAELVDNGLQNLYGSMTPYCFEMDRVQIASMNVPTSQEGNPKPPSALDWRNRHGYNWMTPVKNQEGCGNCYVFATVGGFEARLKIVSNLPDTDIDLSEQFATSCDIRNYGCHGGKLCASAQFMVEMGLPDEKCFPYTSPGKVLPCIKACPDWEDRTIRAKKWKATLTVGEYKLRLMDGPIACWLNPKEDFIYYKGGVYTPIMGEKFIHAVTLCGWNDSLGAWLFKNSWGTDWGDSGYGWINYGEEHIVGPGFPVWLEVEPLKRREEKEEKVISGFSLQVFPNPFTKSTMIKVQSIWGSEKLKEICLQIYDLKGRLVKSFTLTTSVQWDGRNEFGEKLSPGIYFLTLKLSGKVSVKKVILL